VTLIKFILTNKTYFHTIKKPIKLITILRILSPQSPDILFKVRRDYLTDPVNPPKMTQLISVNAPTPTMTFLNEVADQQQRSLCDTIFVIDSDEDDGGLGGITKEIHAIACHLASRSDVFKAMLFGKRRVRINDTSVEIFEILIRFCYGINFSLTKKNVVGVLGTAKKYMLTELQGHCMDAIEKITDIGDILKLIGDLKMKDLFDAIEKVVNRHHLMSQAKMVEMFKVKEFNLLPSELVLKIMEKVKIGNGSSEVKNELIFDSGMEWSKWNDDSIGEEDEKRECGEMDWEKLFDMYF